MAYETCPECGIRKHQLVACSQCGFKRMTIRPMINRELLDEEESSRFHAPTIPPVSSNFENCPACGTNKHLLMACQNCGFSRSKNLERLAKKPIYEQKLRQDINPRYSTRPRHETNTHNADNSRYSDHYRDYYEPRLVEQEQTLSQNIPIVRWKRSKNQGKDHKNPS
ncbi:hypothetical protein CCP3SC5AM1_430008 [Gammaproteobacteria bacterium]